MHNVRMDGVRFVKVKQPYADLLVRGIKDVENRSWAPPNGCGWMFIVSSLSKGNSVFFRDVDASYKAYMRTHEAPTPVPNKTTPWEKQPLVFRPPHDYDYGCIVGIVHVKGGYTEKNMPWPTPWHHLGDVGWVIDDAWKFETPIPLHNDDKFQTQVAWAKNRRYDDEIRRELAKLEPGFR